MLGYLQVSIRPELSMAAHQCAYFAIIRVFCMKAPSDELQNISQVRLTCSSPRRTFFLHALSFECTSKLCGTFLNQFLYYFHIKKMHNTI